ncbi:heptaprenyl diphosphate synthase component 1 [Marinicrinis lubricantis]|uniref:Heptaprenyl diphosphate synthase component 1 n=1 Tax=Marinicrinis lubricantis TaxID=2086470 RepID=A0ABW1IM82_9BACL
MKAVLDAAQKYMSHDMITKHTELPQFPHCRSELLYTFLKHELPQREDIYTLATSLIQMALDTHDLVELDNVEDMREQRAKQLKVLAGDYFSSRFYYLLSYADQIETVKQLAAAICEVNRLKVNLYMKLKNFALTAEEYLNQTVQIRSQLYLSFSNLFRSGKEKLWQDLLIGFTRCELLRDEIRRTETEGLPYAGYGYWMLLERADTEETERIKQEDKPQGLTALVSKYNVFGQMQDMLHTHWKELSFKLKQLEPTVLVKDLLKMGEKLVYTPQKI